MPTTRTGLIKHVAARMDEVTPDNASIQVTVDANDNNPLYSLIDSLVDAGALELFSIAPYFRLPQTAFTDIVLEDVGTPRSIIDGSSRTTGERKVVRLRVPDNFLRVAEINCAEFQRPITEVFPEQSPEGRRQHSPFLVGKNARPVGVMSHGTWETTSDNNTILTPCREIDCYSLSVDTQLDESDIIATYIAKPSVPASGSADIETVVPPILIPCLEWLIAARTFGARGDANHAAICQQNAQNLLV